MKALAPTSAAKAGWLIILLTTAWLAYLLIPFSPGEPATKSPAIPLPATSLTRSGLREYTDWDGLPEIFAIWADKAEWKDGKTRFAYWHPVMKSYSYYFEATRVKGGFRFREIAEPHDPDHHWDESLGEDCPIRFYLTTPAQPKSGPPPAHLSQPLDSFKMDNPRVAIPPGKTKIVPTGKP